MCTNLDIYALLSNRYIASLKRKEWSVNIHKKIDWGLCTFFKIQNSNFISIHISLSLIINRNCFDSLEIGFCDVKNIDKTDFKLDGPASAMDTSIMYPCNLKHCWHCCQCIFCQLTRQLKCKDHQNHIIYNIKIDFYFGEYLSVDVASLFLSRVEVELKDSIGLSSPSRPE